MILFLTIIIFGKYTCYVTEVLIGVFFRKRKYDSRKMRFTLAKAVDKSAVRLRYLTLFQDPVSVRNVINARSRRARIKDALERGSYNDSWFVCRPFPEDMARLRSSTRYMEHNKSSTWRHYAKSIPLFSYPMGLCSLPRYLRPEIVGDLRQSASRFFGDCGNLLRIPELKLICLNSVALRVFGTEASPPRYRWAYKTEVKRYFVELSVE